MIKATTVRELVGVGRQNRERVDLERLPVVIGKKGGLADVSLHDMSVSRMHARISERDGGVWLEDLNSVNGTFLNNMRLRPYEVMELKTEDDVRFGSLDFTYRER